MRLLALVLIFCVLTPCKAQDDVNPYNCYYPTTLDGYVAAYVSYQYIRGEVNNLILKWGQDEVKQGLINYCENREHRNRFKALWSLGDINDPSLVPYIASYLRDTLIHSPARCAISALGKQGFPEAADFLGNYLNDVNLGNKRSSIINLGLITTNEAAGYISEFLEKNKDYRQIEKAQKILLRIQQYNDGRSKKRMLKQLLRGEGEPFAWTVSKLYQSNAPKISFSFLRRLCIKELSDLSRRGDYIRVLELRQYLGDTMTEKEEEEIYMSRAKYHH